MNNVQDLGGERLEDEPWEILEELLESSPAAFVRFFKDESAYSGLHAEPDSPTFLHMDFSRIVRNDWLIHFSDHADAIQYQGFKHGAEDVSQLGLTTYMASRMRGGAGYNFAFTTDTYKQAKERYGWKYGSEAVIFKASGVEVYHWGDAEYQVIFWGPSAKDLVHLYQHEGGWAVGSNRYGEPLFPPSGDEAEDKSLDEVIHWAEANFQQYRRVLTD